MNELELKEFESKYILKLYLKRIMFISAVLREYTEISDTFIIKKLKIAISLYLNELHHSKTKRKCLI